MYLREECIGKARQDAPVKNGTAVTLAGIIDRRPPRMVYKPKVSVSEKEVPQPDMLRVDGKYCYVFPKHQTKRLTFEVGLIDIVEFTPIIKWLGLNSTKIGKVQWAIDFPGMSLYQTSTEENEGCITTYLSSVENLDVPSLRCELYRNISSKYDKLDDDIYLMSLSLDTRTKNGLTKIIQLI